MASIRSFWHDTRGDSIVVEAAILFPIMIMIFAALVLLSMYLPQRALLQEAAQVAATVVANERSDSWIGFDKDARYERKTKQKNVYISAFTSIDESDVEDIVNNLISRGIISVPYKPEVTTRITNYIIYKEVTVTVTQTIPLSQFGLSFIGFPDKLKITQEASATVQNGDEFIRNVDIAKDFVIWVDKKLGVSRGLKSALGRINDIREIFGF